MMVDRSDLAALRYIISGRVQGVGFRWFVLSTANRLGVTGWVRNLRDGRVEILAQGTAGILEAFEAEIHRGPSLSLVENVERLEVSSDMEVHNSFDVR